MRAAWTGLCTAMISSCAETDGRVGAGDLEAFLERDGRTVLTFVGYSGSGYEDPAAMLRVAGRVLAGHDPAKTLVNIGVTPDGIGAVYELAKERGFTTMGIVSAKAREYPPAKHVDHVFYIEDEAWGGYLAGTRTLSPTSASIVRHSDIVVGIGGGAVARDELLAARAAGKQVSFFTADFHHARAIEKARKKGRPAPRDFRGAAAAAWAR